ncbi:MAG: class I SAM-dependent methyltransferase [Candidatus Paceibacterota bacterium]|jgi:ubiquinone/menaquinone biosynthesis C-methylase UbiE
MKKQKLEDNPFEEEKIAREWIISVENEKGLIRDREIYPELFEWTKKNNPKLLVEIGSGQGICSTKVKLGRSAKYVGIEPSRPLVARARDIYKSHNKKFLIGSAYKLPLRSGSVDGVFSVNVWFHLKNLDTAAKEIKRVLKKNKRFYIITGNPSTYEIWERFFFDYKKKKGVLDGKVRVPIQHLSRNIFFLHSLSNIIKSLEVNGLAIGSVKVIGFAKRDKMRGIFIGIEGYKT